jgi:hypothetical protein
MKLDKIGLDKVIHFLVGYIIAVHGFFAAVMFFKIPMIFCLLIGLALGIVAGVAKEVYDSFHPEKHTVDPEDALATILGSVAGTVVTVLIGFVGFRL